MLNSVWADTVQMPAFDPLEGDTKTDVLIIGGGMAGLLCAWELSRAGADCLLMEEDRICGGVTRNTTAKITSQHGLVYHKLLRRFGEETARLYWQANEAALARYRELAKEIPCDFELRDSYVYSIDRPDKLEQELEALNRLNVPAGYRRELPLPIPTVGAVRFRRQAQFHPLKFAAGIARGLNIREGARAQAFEGKSVLTNQGKIRADQIIVATHFPILNKHGAYFLKLYQHRSYLLALENGPDVGGMYVDEAGDGVSFRNYEGMLLLGGGSHRTGKQGNAWSELESLAKLCYPQAREYCRWAAQDCMTLDGVPYIGRYGKRTDGIYVATGFNKWGMTSAMAAAMLLCDLVQGRTNPWSGLFSPARTMLRPQLLVNGAETARSLLTPTAPRCPHLGCALKWNGQERSWDCPCHGSRFSEKGCLLDGPATGDLKSHRDKGKESSGGC